MKKIAMLVMLSASLLFIACSKDYDFEIEKNEQFMLVLNVDGGSSGYCWVWDKKNNVVDTLSVEIIPEGEDFFGGPSQERWTFVGKHKGSTTIILEYKRPWVSDVRKSVVYNVKVK